MPQPIPATSASMLLDRICAKTGVSRLVVTRALYTTLISGFALKKIVFPMVKKYQEVYRSRKANSLLSTIPNAQNIETDDDNVLAVTHFMSNKNQEGGGSSSAAVDVAFFRRLYRLLKIMLPGLWTVEAGLLCAHSITLIARTVLSIHVALLEGIINVHKSSHAIF